MNIETRLLRYFVAVAEELSFTRAAGRLHVAQQALSSQVKRLERDLGVQLLRRTTRKVELTAAGEVFLVDARRALTQIEAAIERTRRVGTGELGRLRVGYTLTAAYEALPRIVDELVLRAPDVEVSTRELYASDLLPDVADAALDVGLAREPEPFPGLEAREIRREPLVAAVSEGHPLAHESEIPLRDLAGETVVVWPREMAPGYYDALKGAFDRADIEATIDTNPAGAALHHNEIARGRRVTLAVASLAFQRPNGVALVTLQPPVPTVGLSLVWHTEDDSAAARRFVSVAEAVSEAEGWISRR